jgi:ATP-dependent DNA helicase PIF1
MLLEYVGREFDPKLVAEPTKLFPTKNKVEQINISKMSALHGDEKEFKIKYIKDLEMTKNDRIKRLDFTEKDIQVELDFLAGNLMCDKEIKLKLGAQVMCIINMKSELGDVLICNGSQGIITEFCTITGCPKVKYNNGIEMIMTRHSWESDKIPGIGVSQIPLILSWALTIHKSQGATLDAAEIDVGSGIFECGQTYVALSRVKSLEGLYLTSFDAKRIRINKKVKEYYDSLRLYNETRETHEEVYIPLVIAEPISFVVATPIEGSSSQNFVPYVEVQAQLSEEKIDEEPNNKSDIKIINIRQST